MERNRLTALQQTQASALAHHVERRMADLEHALRVAAGYLGRGPLPTRAEWHDYVVSLGLPTAYPGVQGFSFVEWIPRADLPAHVRRVRQEGSPDNAVVPGGSSGPLTDGASAILYLEPMNAENQHAFGKDMLEDATHRQAMLQARDTGQVVTSGPLLLYQDANGKDQPGVVLYGPVFREGQPVATVAERRAALRGWVTIPLRVRTFIQATLTKYQQQAELSLGERERGHWTPLYESGVSRAVTEAETTWTLHIPGRTWVARIVPSAAFYRQVGHAHHWQFLLGGAVISLLIFTVLVLQTGAEARARRLARLRGEELLASEAQFRALFEKAPFGMAIVDSGSGRFLSVNAHLGKILGYTPEELLTRNFQSLTHPEHLEADLASVRDLASGAVPIIHKEKRYLHRDGHVVWARLSMVKLPVTVGDPARHLSMVEDITEARARDSQLRASEERFRETFNLSPDPMTLTRLSDGLLVEVNQSWCELTGIPREECLGRSTTELGLWTRPDEREVFVAGIQEAGAYGPAEITLKGRDGREHRLLVTAKTMALAGDPCFLSLGKDVTRRYQLEEAMRRSEADLAHAQEIGEFGSWRVVFDGEGEVWSGSEGLRRLYGFGPDQSITMQTGLDMMHPEDRAFAQAAWDAALAGRGPSEWEHRIVVGGEVRWVAVRVQFQFSPDGQLQEASGINQDITRRRAAEQALRNSEARLRILGDQLPDSFLYQYLSRPGEVPRFVYLSAGVERLCGVSPEAVLEDAMVLLGQMDPAMLPAYFEAEATSARELTPFVMDLRQRHTDGNWRWFRVRSMPRPQPDGSVIWEGISTDVTDRHQSQLRLEESEARFRAVIEDGPAPLFLHRDGRFIYLNPAALRLLKAESAEDLLGQPVLDRVHPEDRAQVVERIRVALATGAEAPLLEERFIAMDGSVLDVEAVGRAVTVDGQPTILVFAQDVSDRKQAEAAVVRAQKAESLVLMAGSIAHDFNNIFQGVLGFIEVAKIRAGQNLEVSQMLGKAEGSLRKAIGLSWKMLDFSGRALVKQEPLDLEAWLPAFAATLQLELPATLLLDVSCAPVPFILGDRVRLEEVMQALLANAREAAEPLAGRVRVRLFTDFGTDRPGPASPGTWPLARPELPATVCLEVADAGPGVAAAILERICDPFFTTHAMGRGLGLASVAGILQGHRAGLHLFNGEQGGLVVRMHFPPSGA
ncbi:MAG: PAS domain S-box protein [Geothrix sp.]|uniref:PAS domain S-box protein n=1 Tax=Geothrix sp. TaxID=1962974 RepID=UPI003BAEC199